ncbi:MAG: glycerol defect 1 suppressor [Lasallia pustulata]|uniref:Glycerol defect 1 suppressor n=1 Tax=Lasallia pustulata TaxID=136370 RepID=A0A5M8PNW6_9LECA|nr:MAG: glycerol defect 1 suppressor [Lasallia pustulata]
MRRPTHNAAKLPRKLLEELGVNDDNLNGGRGKRNGPRARKERRRASRVEKKESHVKPRPSGPLQHLRKVIRSPSLDDSDDDAPRNPPAGVRQGLSKESEEGARVPKSILKRPKPKDSPIQSESDPESPQLAPPMSRGVKDRLAADDAEIAALEKALGVKGKKKLPKSFEDDGLDSLLAEMDSSHEEGERKRGKKRRTDDDEWLERKRRKARGMDANDGNSRLYPEASESSGENPEAESDVNSISDGIDEDQSIDIGADSMVSSFDGLESDTQSTGPPKKKIRENPYVAPTVPPIIASSGKYIPPSLRENSTAEKQDLSRLRRQLQGLLNRLSEASLIAILGDTEKLYRDHPRQHLSSTLIDLLLGLLSDTTSLQDTFIILHAGFIAALYKVIGTDFGAQVVQRVVEEFDKFYALQTDGEASRKELTNLISLLAELYNFHVIGSGLIYDFIRIFLEGLSENNTELLLKIIRNSGPQLRHDDPSALKDVVLLLQSAVARVGEGNLSVRTKFMIETINNLKNNRMKTGVVASNVTSEHTIRMKKTLGSLNSRTIRAGEPLRIGLKDIRDTDKRGKWWLIGASYKDEDRNDQDVAALHSKLQSSPHSEDVEMVDHGGADLLQLAREQRMNTDVRRSIFVSIMSATDYRDAHLRLLKLRLKKSQELEIPKVLIHCAGAEKIYNPYYTLIARKLCSDRKLKMAFQFSLWGLFKRMGEGEEDVEEDFDEQDEQDDALGMRSVVNLAKLYGILVAEGGFGLGVLKTLNLAYLQSKIRTFVELMLITVIVHSQQGLENRRNEKPLMNIFLKLEQTPQLVRGLQYFLKKVVGKTDVASSRKDKETVKWGCKIAGTALTAIASSKVADE